MAKNIQLNKTVLGVFLLVMMMSNCVVLASHALPYQREENAFIDEAPHRIPLNPLGDIRNALESPRWPYQENNITYDDLASGLALWTMGISVFSFRTWVECTVMSDATLQEGRTTLTWMQGILRQYDNLVALYIDHPQH